MNQRILYVTVALAIGLSQPTLCQSDTSQAGRERTAFAMTRATLEFLATDAKTYGYKKTPCEPCATYADLHQFVKKNNLTRADELIADVQKRAAQASPADLQTYLLKRVTEGSDHAHRTKLASFADYQRALNAAVGRSSIAGETLTAAQQSADADVFDEEPSVGDSTEADTSVNTAFTPETTSSQPSPNAQSSMLTWLPLVLSLLSLAGVVVLFFRQRNRPDATTDVSSDMIKEMSGRISKLERTNTNLYNQVALLEKAVLQTRPAPASQSQSRSTSPASTPPPTPVPAPPPSAPVVPKPEPEVPPVATAPPANTFRTPRPTAPTLLYGRTADLGDGFSVGGLSTNPDRDTVFEIRRLDTNRAEFQVSDNPDLQRLALSDPYSYLNDTCTYATQPRPGSRIRTERPGALSLQGEKWVITEKAQISFTG